MAWLSSHGERLVRTEAFRLTEYSCTTRTLHYSSPSLSLTASHSLSSPGSLATWLPVVMVVVMVMVLMMVVSVLFRPGKRPGAVQSVTAHCSVQYPPLPTEDQVTVPRPRPYFADNLFFIMNNLGNKPTKVRLR